MGWLYTFKEPGTSTNEFFKKKFTWDHGTALDSATVGFRESYTALQLNNGKVIAVVCMIDHRPHDAYNFGYKDMEESMGPGITNCPKRSLKMLSPVEDLYKGDGLKWATEWRKECWDAIKRAEKAANIQIGDVIEFELPIYLSNGSREKTFVRVESYGYRKRKVFFGLTARVRTRLSFRNISSPYTIIRGERMCK